MCLYDLHNIIHTLVTLNVSLFCVWALDNGQTLTPPMGWLSWTRFMCNMRCDTQPDNCVSEKLYKQMADLLVSDGYLQAGYNRLNVDDCWAQKGRDTQGRLQAAPDRFPAGMKRLGEYVHGKGLLYGMYATYGKRTCMGFAGTLPENMVTDAQLFADWQIDYLKLDGCFNDPKTLPKAYIQMGAALNQTGRAVVYSCSWPYYELIDGSSQPDYELIVRHCNLWRNWHDISINWKSILGIIDFYDLHQQQLAEFHGPGHWNDPDMVGFVFGLIIGNPGLSVSQCRVQMSIWCLWAAPLLMSNDLRDMMPHTKQILQNRDLIAVNQDTMGKMGIKILTLGSVGVYRKQIHPITTTRHTTQNSQIQYSYAIGFFNRHSTKEGIDSVLLSAVGLDHVDGYELSDLWGNKSLGRFYPGDSFHFKVPPMDIIVIKATIIGLESTTRSQTSLPNNWPENYVQRPKIILLCVFSIGIVKILYTILFRRRKTMFYSLTCAYLLIIFVYLMKLIS